MKKFLKPEIIIAFIIITIGIITRFLPHVPNFVPITAIALFAGRYLPKKIAIIAPLLIMLVTDYFIGFHEVMIFVYGGILLAAILGVTLKKKPSWGKIFGATLASSIAFFIITNFGVWIMNSWYPHTFAGLAQCFVMAIPFFRNSLLGDFFYVTVFFGAYEMAKYFVENKKISLTALRIK